ncbi:MAG TPA: FAD-dependent oxidoreductase [Actinomycetota bacterium]|nr:FAD-dependent oxidoreductase [Actinomycetota bacterium]
MPGETCTEAVDSGRLAETPDLTGAFPRLEEEQIAELVPEGYRRPTEAGEILYREGDPSCDFVVILSGMVKIVEGFGSDSERVISVHSPRRFLGELNLLTGQAVFVTAVVAEAGEVLVVPVDRLRQVVARKPGIGDLILRAYLLRRSWLIGLGTGLKVIGSRYSPDTRRIREFAARNRVPHRWLDLERDPTAEALMRTLGIRPEETPVVILGNNRLLRNPGNAELARVIGLSPRAVTPGLCDLLVIGAGPAGLAAGVYGASEGLATIVLDCTATGGQAGLSPRIENYLGFPSGISGSELAERAVIQANKFGAQISVPVEAMGLESRDGHHLVRLDGGTTIMSLAVLIATGAHYRRLDVPGLERFEGISVHYAATESEIQVCRGDPVAVVGGGNSAGQAAVSLSATATKVHLLLRHDDLGRDMSRYLVDQIEQNPNIEVHRNTEVRELIGGDTLEQIVLEEVTSGERTTLGVRALFVFIGADPQTGWLDGQIALDDHGFVLTGAAAASSSEGDGSTPLLLETSRPGVFAAGDVRSGSVRRLASAVGEGAMSVRLVHERLQA